MFAQRFEFTRMWEGEIAQEIGIRLNAGACDCAGDSNLLDAVWSDRAKIHSNAGEREIARMIRIRSNMKACNRAR